MNNCDISSEVARRVPDNLCLDGLRIIPQQPWDSVKSPAVKSPAVKSPAVNSRDVQMHDVKIPAVEIGV